jgi:hypothetical protein
MFCPRPHKVSMVDWTPSGLSAFITPTPCVPLSSLMMMGVPPTASTALRMDSGVRAMAVRGMPTSCADRYCSARSLSREREMAMVELTLGTPARSKWVSTAMP